VTALVLSNIVLTFENDHRDVGVLTMQFTRDAQSDYPRTDDRYIEMVGLIAILSSRHSSRTSNPIMVVSALLTRVLNAYIQYACHLPLKSC
jgi:hypothetical protein